MRIETVVHCQALERPWYSKLLRSQLSYFTTFPPTKCQQIITICLCPEDRLTELAVVEFEEQLPLNLFYLDKESLGRRAIGRNLAAKRSLGDIVWFTDCDYLIGQQPLDALADYYKSWPKDVSMIFPTTTTVVGGKSSVERVNHRAIGGLQIIRGTDARKYGYCDKREAFQTPTNGEFASCRCDRPFRKECSLRGEIRGIDLPGLLRLTHPRRRNQ